jgi:hypothetical protein
MEPGYALVQHAQAGMDVSEKASPRACEVAEQQAENGVEKTLNTFLWSRR